MKKVSVASLDELNQQLDQQPASTTVLILFTGAKDQAGHSWCPDCNQADPVIDKVAKDSDYPDDQFVLVTVDVGQRNEWKDPKNVFRTHQDFRVACVPTLIKWRSPLRLEEEKCADEELVRMLIEE